MAVSIMIYLDDHDSGFVRASAAFSRALMRRVQDAIGTVLPGDWLNSR